MTRAQEVYAATLNLLGTGPLDPELQKTIDAEHAEAYPAFKQVLEERAHLMADSTQSG